MNPILRKKGVPSIDPCVGCEHRCSYSVFLFQSFLVRLLQPEYKLNKAEDRPWNTTTIDPVNEPSSCKRLPRKRVTLSVHSRISNPPSTSNISAFYMASNVFAAKTTHQPSLYTCSRLPEDCSSRKPKTKLTELSEPPVTLPALPSVRVPHKICLQTIIACIAILDLITVLITVDR